MQFRTLATQIVQTGDDTRQIIISYFLYVSGYSLNLIRSATLGARIGGRDPGGLTGMGRRGEQAARDVNRICTVSPVDSRELTRVERRRRDAVSGESGTKLGSERRCQVGVRFRNVDSVP